MNTTHSLPRFLSKRGALSRAKAEVAILAGRVTLDGRVCRDPKRRVVEGESRVELDGRVVEQSNAQPTWLAMNKPRGVVTTTSDPNGRPTVMSLLPPGQPATLAPVGRLDADTGGLLLFTDDHVTAAALLDPEQHVEKLYRAKVRGKPSPETCALLGTDTVQVDGVMLGPMQVRVLREGPKSAWLEVRLSEGKNRQVRRRLAHAGHEVEVLVRDAFGPVELGELAPGASRPLTEAEVRALSAAPKRAKSPARAAPRVLRR